MERALRLQPGQEHLTRAQEVEARRFAQAYLEVQLSTEPVDEQEAEVLLHHAYEVARLPPPARIQWLDGPVPLAVAVGAGSTMARQGSLRDRVAGRVRDRVEVTVPLSLRIHLLGLITTSVEVRTLGQVANLVADSVADTVEAGVTTDGEGAYPEERVWSSVGAYYEASWLSGFAFLDGALAPNALQALAHFNQVVSGYWLGTEIALLVRRPTSLSLDASGRLHSPTGRAITYHDGWGCYAWHGVRVPERVILAPESLTREDVLQEPNVEVRRVMQERMGERFLRKLGGQVIDTSPYGTLYEVRLPEDDPEGVTRYVQVQDATTVRQYVLRVPPTVQTAAEAVAWSFQLAVEEYHPAQET